jgi:hypothetical protein
VLGQRLQQAQSRGARTFALAGLVVLFGAAIQGVGNYNFPITSNLMYLALAIVLAMSGHEAPAVVAEPRLNR